MEKAIEFILVKFPFIRQRLDVHLLEVLNGAAVALMLKVLGAGLTFCFNLLLARTLGAEGAGLYFLALTVATIATVVGRMGLDNTLLRFTAENAAVGDWVAVKGVYWQGMRLAILASLTSAIIMFFSAPLFADMVFHKPELISPMRWMALAVVPMSILILHAEMIKGLKRIRDSLLVYGVGVPALSLVGLYFLGSTYSVQGAVWAYTIAVLLTMIVGAMFWWSAVPQLRNIAGHFEIRELLESSRPLWGAKLLSMITNWTAILVLGIWGTEEDIGTFSIASRTVMVTSLVLMSVNSISAPKFATLYKNGEIKALGLTARNTTKLTTFMASPLLLLFLFYPKGVMQIFGSDFESGTILLSILAIGQFVNVASGSVGYLLMMTGNESLMRNIAAFIAAMSVFLNIVFISFYGAVGAAIVTTICLSLQNIISVYLVWVRLRIFTVPFVKTGKIFNNLDSR